MGKGRNSIIRRFANALPAVVLDFLLQNWLLVLVALVSGGMLLWPAIGRGGPGAVTVNEAVQLINREKAVLIDVCEPAEYAAGHAAGARSVPLGSLESNPKALPTNKALPVVVVCQSGTRASRAVGVLRKLGYENARVLAGGMRAWREANMPVEKSA